MRTEKSYTPESHGVEKKERKVSGENYDAHHTRFCGVRPCTPPRMDALAPSISELRGKRNQPATMHGQEKLNENNDYAFHNTQQCRQQKLTVTAYDFLAFQGRSKPELENLEPRTQDLARFGNSIL